MYQINPNESNFKFPNKIVLVIGDWNLGFVWDLGFGICLGFGIWDLEFERFLIMAPA